ncbi:hypothetical protein [Lactococcus cremoris]|uniref:hypothetical protein n=1 Tax=Lactococcus lactis subsp. cremoris TaxID=1359 RepID=UPI002182186D|nr:hypothetical protein [Lactococcus cremoris]
MSELETARELAETAVRQVNVFALQGDKVDFLINQLKQIASLPQLTIPKSIADELDSTFAVIDATDIGYMLDQTGPYGSIAFNDYYFKNKNIIALYLAGKALGVDLVKVV